MKVFIKSFLKNLIDTLMESEEFQQLIIWELADMDNVAASITVKREIYFEGFLEQSKNSLEKAGVNLNFLLAVLIGGIYYLIIHKNNINFVKLT